MSQELIEGDCAEELGASSASARLMTRPRRMSAGVEDGSKDEADNDGRHCPGLVSVHFCTVDCCAEPELVGCSCIACGAAESRTGTHSAQRVLEKPLRQWMPQNGL